MSDHGTAVHGRTRKATNLSLPENLVAAAAELGINVSRACERGLREAVSEARRQKWLEENRDAFDFWNREIEEHGLPFDEYRQV